LRHDVRIFPTMLHGLASRLPFDNPNRESATLCVSLRLHRRIRTVIKARLKRSKDGRSLP
jgi:hypothetical protein